MFCPGCRTELPDDSKYCYRCGYDFSRIKTPPPRESEDPFDQLDTLTGSERGKDISDLAQTPKESAVKGESLKEGDCFANRYEILSEGKIGGMGGVFKCKDKKLNRTKALKVIHPRLLESEQAIQRFRQEVSISQELQHKNIVKVYDLDEYNGVEFFTMEWIEGKSLRDILNERKKEKKPFSLTETQMLIGQLADALAFAHRYTVHRDVKPENILVTESKEGIQIKLTDFGIAKMLNPSHLTSTSVQMGTPYYMAPEQKVNAAQVDGRADIYATGVVLFELLTLENTIGFELPSQMRRDLPKEIDEIVKKALATKVEDRYSRIEDLSLALDELVASTKGINRKSMPPAEVPEMGEEKTTPTTPQVIKKSERPKYPMKIIIAVCAVLAIGAIAFFSLRNGGSRSMGPSNVVPVPESKGKGPILAGGDSSRAAPLEKTEVKKEMNQAPGQKPPSGSPIAVPEPKPEKGKTSAVPAEKPVAEKEKDQGAGDKKTVPPVSGKPLPAEPPKEKPPAVQTMESPRTIPAEKVESKKEKTHDPVPVAKTDSSVAAPEPKPEKGKTSVVPVEKPVAEKEKDQGAGDKKTAPPVSGKPLPAEPQREKPAPVQLPAGDNKVIRAIGFGVEPSAPNMNPAAKELSAKRAAKLIALRNLAEQVYGVKVAGETTVKESMTQSDEVRTSVTAFIQGAKVVSEKKLSDGSYEVEVEVEVESLKKAVHK